MLCSVKKARHNSSRILYFYLYEIPRIGYSRQKKIDDCQGLRGREKGEHGLKGLGVSCLSEEHVLELGRGGSCMTL